MSETIKSDLTKILLAIFATSALSTASTVTVLSTKIAYSERAIAENTSAIRDNQTRIRENEIKIAKIEK